MEVQRKTPTPRTIATWFGRKALTHYKWALAVLLFPGPYADIVVAWDHLEQAALAWESRKAVQRLIRAKRELSQALIDAVDDKNGLYSLGSKTTVYDYIDRRMAAIVLRERALDLVKKVRGW